MKKLGFYYNMNTCVACGACQLACKDAHKLKAGEFFRRVDMMKEGPYSGTCNHCEDAACVNACPTGAMYKAEDGTTRHDDGKCIGCGACAATCKNGSAMLFVAARVSSLAKLPQGRVEGARRAKAMVAKMDELGFGNCTNTGACQAECPKGISITHIARLNREFLSAKIKE